MKLRYTYAILMIIAAFVLLVMRSSTTGRYNVAPQMQSCAGGTCHNASALGTLTIDSIALFDTATGQFVSSYLPGRRYRVGFVARYDGTANLHKFGYVVSNNGRGSFSKFSPNAAGLVAAGTGYWGHSAPKDSALRIVLGPVSRTYYTDTAVFTAPAAGSGIVTLSMRLNAVNAMGNNTGDLSNTTLYFRQFQEYSAIVNIARTTPPFGAICAGQTVTFTATPTNGGATPTYQWRLNSTNVGTGGTTYTTNTLNNSDTIRCIMTSSISGVGNNPDTSNAIIVTINNAFVNNPTIVANKNPACAGDTVTYTCTPATGSLGSQFRWFYNGVQVAGPPLSASSPTYNKNGGLVNGDTIRATVTVGNPCASANPGSSNTITMTVNPSPVISNVVNQTLCSGDSTAATSWSSSLPSTTYTWTNSNPALGIPANGTGQLGKYLVTNNGANLDSMTISVRPNAAGCNGAIARLKIYVRPVARVRKPADQIYCSGANASLNFVTIPAVGPVVSWTNSNAAVGLGASGTGNLNFTANNSGSDSATAVITVRATNAGCVGPDSIFNVKVYRTPNVTKPADASYCGGSNVPGSSFTSDMTSGVTYTWTNTNAAIGLGTSGTGDYTAYTAPSVTIPEVGTIALRGQFKTCISPPQTYTITVEAPSNPTITVSTADTVVCQGSLIRFTSAITNGGPTPTYEWFKDGVPFGNGKDTVSFFASGGNEEIWCKLTSSSACATTPIVNSAKKIVKPTQSIKHTVQILTIRDTVCEGNPIQFTAQITNGGANPIYHWYVNDVLVSSGSGSGSDIFASTSLTDRSTVKCHVESSILCVQDSIAISNTKNIRVFPIVPTNMTMSKNKSDICSDDLVTFTTDTKGGGMEPKFVWTLNGVDMQNDASSMTIPISSQFDQVQVTFTSGHVCAQPKSHTAALSVERVVQGPIADYLPSPPSNYIAFCEGDSALVKVFNGQPDFQYQWSNGVTADSFFSNVSTSYRLTITSPSYQCKRVYGPLTTYMLPKPLKPYITLQPNAVLLSTFHDNYQWQLNKLDIVNASNQEYTYVLPGLYRMKIVNTAGCAAYSDELDPTRAGVLSGNMRMIQVYPNPSKGQFSILSNTSLMKKVIIYDAYGRVVYSQNMSTKKQDVQVDKLPKGNYIIQVYTDKDSYQEKLILQ